MLIECLPFGSLGGFGQTAHSLPHNCDSSGKSVLCPEGAVVLLGTPLLFWSWSSQDLGSHLVGRSAHLASRAPALSSWALSRFPPSQGCQGIQSWEERKPLLFRCQYGGTQDADPPAATQGVVDTVVNEIQLLCGLYLRPGGQRQGGLGIRRPWCLQGVRPGEAFKKVF